MTQGSVYGVIITVISFHESFYTKRLLVDVVWSATPLSEWSLMLSAGFFDFELLS